MYKAKPWGIETWGVRYNYASQALLIFFLFPFFMHFFHRFTCRVCGCVKNVLSKQIILKMKVTTTPPRQPLKKAYTVIAP